MLLKFDHHGSLPISQMNQELALMPLNGGLFSAFDADWNAFDEYLLPSPPRFSTPGIATPSGDLFTNGGSALFDPFGLSAGVPHTPVTVENEHATDSTENWALLMDLAFASGLPK